MAEVAVAPAVQILLQNLISVLDEQISLVLDFKKDLTKLKKSVLMIQALFDDAEKKPVTNKAEKLWLKNLENVAFDADNVLDELNYQLLSNKIKMKKKVRCFFPDLYRLKMARKIKNINKTMQEINQEASEYGLHKTPASAYAPRAVSDLCGGLETDAFSIDPVFLGREDDVSKIVHMMTTSSDDEIFYVLPIVGMGGLGKSTIARKIFHHEKIKAHFDNHLWVHVSQNYDVVLLLKKILTSLTQENVELGNKQFLLEKLKKSLGVERFLLVLDDVWNKNRKEWEDFIMPLSTICSVSGNGIIVTTRSETVASLVATIHIHKLENLSEDNCWYIIKANAFRSEANISQEFGIIGESIAKRCQGLPLAAKVVGGLLRDKSINEWLSIEKNWLSDSENENSISSILKLSYDHLSSSSLKKCFAYCSVFPKGFRLNREQLIELWMAEGFLSQTDEENDMENVGNKFLSLLLRNSLLQVVERDYYGNITYCNMHDLVHDLASSVLSPKIKDNFLDEVRYICLETFNQESCRNLRKQCLRTLFFNGKVSDIMFSDFKSLHVLILTSGLYELDAVELPSAIGKLIHLRCFDFSDIRIECLPDSIGELYHLQTLRALSFRLKKLPNTIKYLINLRHLHIRLIELPPEMGRLTSLQTLPCFGVGNEKGRGIGELGSLKNLKGKLEIYNLEKVQHKEEAKSADLIQKPNVFRLKLAWDASRDGENNDGNVLEGLQPHPNLKSLEIYGFRGRNFPSWCSKMTGLDNLMEIRLQNCKECKEVPMLGHLPHLKSLYLIDLDNVRSIGSSFYGVCENRTTVFPALERLELWNMPNLREWLEAKLSDAAQNQLSRMVVFPCLKYLTVIYCNQLMSVPSHFPHLEELQIAHIQSGLPLANICGVNLISLAKLRIDSIDGLMCLPEWLFCNNQNLSQLEVSFCPNLTHLVPCFQGGGASLRELSISNCPNLEKLPDDLHSLVTVERLCIEGCKNLKSTPYQRGGQSQSRCTSLRELTINFIHELTNLPFEMIIGCSHKMPHLSSLTIDAPTITNPTVMEDIGSLGSLRY